MKPIRRITILYDSACGLCTFAKDWMLRQSAWVELSFIAAGSPEAGRAFPQLSARELFVVADTGEVWFGNRAWIVCLWALREYREVAFRLTSPALSLLAREAFVAVSKNRLAISHWLHLQDAWEMAQQLRAVSAPECRVK